MAAKVPLTPKFNTFGSPWRWMAKRTTALLESLERRLFARPRFIQCAWDHESMVLGYAAGLVYRTEGILLVFMHGGKWHRPDGVMPVTLHGEQVTVRLTGIGLRGKVTEQALALPLRPTRKHPAPLLRAPLFNLAARQWSEPVARPEVLTTRNWQRVPRIPTHDPLALRRSSIRTAPRTLIT